jgi:hypothetical protein
MFSLRRNKNGTGKKKNYASKKAKIEESPELQLQEDHISPLDHENIDE